MATKQLKEIQGLLKAHIIVFDGPVEPEQWPSTHATLYKNIKRAGNTRYNEYKDLRKARAADEPWAYAIQRADNLVKTAKRCHSEARNEAGWRLAMEPEVFSRFTVEVACTTCRARLWRSEIEAEVKSNTIGGRSLEERQKRRRACQCGPSSRQQDFNDPGLNPLFSDRAEKRVLHDEIVTMQLPKRDHPDRVYGLRETTRFSRVLSSPCRALIDRPIREVLKLSPFRTANDPLLFPFLVLEAKSERGYCWDWIETQTAFSIRTLLQLQEDLQNQSDPELSWEDGPLVWFLATYIELWGGRLVTNDGAIQLLLIIDHIFDWARDMYREAILHHLDLLFGTNPNETATKYNDSDIFSVANRLSSWINGIQSLGPADAMAPETFEETLDDIRPFRNMDSPYGVLRHSGFIDSEFLGLHITGDNLQTLLLCCDSPEEIRIYACKLLKALLNSNSLSLTEGTFNELEGIWTGAASHLQNALPSNTEFVVRMFLKSWLTDDWDQVRELAYIAMSRNDLDLLIKISGLKTHFKDFGFSCDAESVINLFKSYRQKSRRESLEAAISRATFSLEMPTDEYLDDDIMTALDDESDDNSMTEYDGDSDDQLIITNDDNSSLMDANRSKPILIRGDERNEAYDIIHEVYRKHKIGLWDVKEPFIRKSTRLDGPLLIICPESRRADNVYVFTSKVGGSFVYYSGSGRHYTSPRSEYRFIVVVAESTESEFSEPPVEVCFFMASGPPVLPMASDVMQALRETLRTERPIYKTLLYAKPQLAGERNPCRPYGGPLTLQQREKIQRWIDHLCKNTGCSPST